ncbi:AMP-dependent synthetase [Seongchinamella sediminis]|uniref:AMP-dependent synthetase n=1 Tax=Seongchinamella sediminis TaxID=2283635 RepID=A0A3L7E1A6_9GAMM|nr:class I adenylate-forming enzyme family protein [Seongchinamella sediminis]RLQ22645.1 AMP-dependent synthetase [Seongchinamella sediminis]
MYEQLAQVISKMTAPGEMFEIRETEVAGQTMKTWALAPPSLRDLWLGTAGHQDKTYLVYQDERWTYAEAHEQVARIAGWLSANGIGQHDRVAIAMRNYPEWLLTYWALASIGAVSVGVNAWWVADELQYGLQDSAVSMIICDQERLDRFARIRGSLPGVQAVAVRTDTTPEWATPWSAVLQAEPSIAEVSIDPEDDACIFYTSGTTGKPKGAQLTHRGCANNVFSALFATLSQTTAHAMIEGQEPVSPGDPSQPQPAAIIATPLFHVTANNVVAHALTVAGGKLVSMYKWDAAEALRIIEEEKITNFSGVPVMSREIIHHPDFSRRDTSSLRLLGGGGAPVQPDLTEKVMQRGGNAMPSQGYGLTETSGLAASSWGVFLNDKPNSAGRILPVFDVKAVDAEGNTLPTGEIGEICFRGPQIIKGYLNRPEDTAETIIDGWLHTGDIGYVDADNFVFLVDRAKDMVLRGGENVYCSEVEAAIFKHDAVAEAVVFSVPDERLGEEVGAAIVPVEGQSLSAAEIRTFCADKLAAFKIPRHIWILDAPLPRNASGKFVKRTLQDMLDLADAG